MKRFLAAALALGLAATSIPGTAEARGWGHGYYGHHRGGAVAAGVVGLAFGTILGAAIADGNRGRYYDRCYDRCGGYYGDSYYDDGYYDDGYGPSVCIVRERHWDRYRGREVIIEHRRPC